MHHTLFIGIALLVLAGYTFHEALEDSTWRRLKVYTGIGMTVAGVGLLIVHFA